MLLLVEYVLKHLRGKSNSLMKFQHLRRKLFSHISLSLCQLSIISKLDALMPPRQRDELRVAHLPTINHIKWISSERLRLSRLCTENREETLSLGCFLGESRVINLRFHYTTNAGKNERARKSIRFGADEKRLDGSQAKKNPCNYRWWLSYSGSLL